VESPPPPAELSPPVVCFCFGGAKEQQGVCRASHNTGTNQSIAEAAAAVPVEQCASVCTSVLRYRGTNGGHLEQ
jgi:hypothetical protein